MGGWGAESNEAARICHERSRLSGREIILVRKIGAFPALGNLWLSGGMPVATPLEEGTDFEQRADRPGAPTAEDPSLQRESAWGCLSWNAACCSEVGFLPSLPVLRWRSPSSAPGFLETGGWRSEASASYTSHVYYFIQSE